MRWIFLYLPLFFEYGHKKALHHTYHKDYETWDFLKVKLDDTGDFWDSEHFVTCSKCSHGYTARRALMVKGRWGTMGNDRAGAIEYAKTFNKDIN